MTLYAIVDEELKIAKHKSKGRMGIFSNLGLLERHAWRYKKPKKKYKIAELEISQIYEFEEVDE